MVPVKTTEALRALHLHTLAPRLPDNAAGSGVAQVFQPLPDRREVLLDACELIDSLA